METTQTNPTSPAPATPVSHRKQMIIAAVGVAILIAIGGYWYMNNKDMIAELRGTQQGYESSDMMPYPESANMDAIIMEEEIPPTEFDAELDTNVEDTDSMFQEIDMNLEAI